MLYQITDTDTTRKFGLLTFDTANPPLSDLPESLVTFVAQRITESASFSRQDRTYDFEAVVGSDLHGEDTSELRKVLETMCTMPDCPFERIPGTDRYQIRRSILLDMEVLRDF